MFRRPIRHRFLPYERIFDKPLPVLPVEEVERILKEIESGNYNAMTTTAECEDEENKEFPDKAYNLETKLHCWISMPEYTTKEVVASIPQLPLPDQPGPDSASSKTTNTQTSISDFDFEIVQF
ncbi:unnamed protein product [Cylicostephanus goldi]|uniref:Uncharacterized protein n=1 Tax=Cylicostephanus goldi TaxID=71465 RepID=A0A3P6SCH2_CYLGO|nr:unnamed protein product [Cylicostephanus goldi]